MYYNFYGVIWSAVKVRRLMGSTELLKLIFSSYAVEAVNDAMHKC
jgi:hypothetical protein